MVSLSVAGVSANTLFVSSGLAPTRNTARAFGAAAPPAAASAHFAVFSASAKATLKFFLYFARITR